MGANIAVLIDQITGKGTQNLSGALDFLGFDKPKKKKKATATGAKDKLKVTPQSRAKKGARAAIVVGSPRGILDIEDQAATSGRGTILRN